MKVGKLKNGKAAGKDEITNEMIKEEVIGWWIGSGGYVIWSESFVGPEDRRSAVIVLLYKDKGERTECKNYRGISLLSVVEKIYAGILVESP